MFEGREDLIDFVEHQKLIISWLQHRVLQKHVIKVQMIQIVNCNHYKNSVNKKQVSIKFNVDSCLRLKLFSRASNLAQTLLANYYLSYTDVADSFNAINTFLFVSIRD
jgi:hypothetical protein